MSKKKEYKTQAFRVELQVSGKWKGKQVKDKTRDAIGTRHDGAYKV